MSRWQLQEAKARFSELVRTANAQGPQEITLHGEPTAVLLSWVDFQRLVGHRDSFVDFMRGSPLCGEDLVLERDSSGERRLEI